MKGLTQLEKELIEAKANEITQKYGTTSGDIDVIKIARNMGFLIGEMELKDEEDGFIVVNENEDSVLGQSSNKLIVVNSDRDALLKYFVIAHELGHYVLRDNVNEPIFAHRENKKGKNEKENEIDFFAACLLMPRERFKKVYESLNVVYEDNENKLLNELSEYFHAPLLSVARRVEEIRE